MLKFYYKNKAVVSYTLAMFYIKFGPIVINIALYAC
jgi:hypothetical protein